MSLWERVPEEIVEEVMTQIEFLSDFIRFGTVCKAWYAIFLKQKRRRIERYGNEVPMLFIPPAPTPPTTRSCFKGVKLLPNQMFHMLEYKCYNNNSMSTSLTPSLRILSASYGWLATIIQDKPRDLIINLKNPMTGNTISLPPIHVDGYYSVWRSEVIVLSCNPCIYPPGNNNNNNNNCVVAYSRASDIWFIRLGQKSWNNFTMVVRSIEAMLFHNGELYVLDSFKNLFAIHCDWDGDKCYFQSYHVVRTSDSRACRKLKLYLVESVGGELLKIEKNNEDTGYTIHMNDIMVYKLVVISCDDGIINGHWVRIHQLGNGNGNGGEVLFLSACNAICSKSRSLKPDSVYVFDTRIICGFEIRRIISLKENRTPREIFCATKYRRSENTDTDLQPLWINPTLQ